MTRTNTSLSYSPFEGLCVPRPVRRIDHLAGAVKGLRVLDLGAYDESVVDRPRARGWRWLHEELAKSANSVLGIDASRALESRGELRTGPSSRIVFGTVESRQTEIRDFNPEIIIAGELIEHLESPLQWLRELGALCPGTRIVMTTPNATSFLNMALAFANRENCDPDHVAVYSFKTLAKVSSRARIGDAIITPYYYDTQLLGFRFPWMPRAVLRLVDAVLFMPLQFLFPLTSFGLILDGTLPPGRR